MQCGSLRGAAGFLKSASRSFPEKVELTAYRETLNCKLYLHMKSKEVDLDTISIEDYPDKGLVRRELYPWNHHEPDRFSPDALNFLNDEMRRVAPKLEVRAVELPILK